MNRTKAGFYFLLILFVTISCQEKNAKNAKEVKPIDEQDKTFIFDNVLRIISQEKGFLKPCMDSIFSEINLFHYFVNERDEAIKNNSKFTVTFTCPGVFQIAFYTESNDKITFVLNNYEGPFIVLEFSPDIMVLIDKVHLLTAVFQKFHQYGDFTRNNLKKISIINPQNLLPSLAFVRKNSEPRLKAIKYDYSDNKMLYSFPIEMDISSLDLLSIEYSQLISLRDSNQSGNLRVGILGNQELSNYFLHYPRWAEP